MGADRLDVTAQLQRQGVLVGYLKKFTMPRSTYSIIPSI